MASAVIHMAVANELNKTLKRTEANFLLGSIAPDIAKIIGEDKKKSHFISDKYGDDPDINKFLSIYKYDLDDDFVLGYYVHLYTDYLWFKYFITDFSYNGWIKKLDGTVVNCDYETSWLYIYNNYTDLNIKIIDKYD